MTNSLDLRRVFAGDAADLIHAREAARLMHPTDIRAAGNEVEHAVRDYFKQRLPPRYHVTSGHLIDSAHRVSPQLDIIIADNLLLPSLMTGKDGTEYVPATSAFAIGEVKSTYYRSQRYFEKCHSTLRTISELDRPLTANTVYGGLRQDSTITDMARGSQNKYLNSLFSFLICVDGGDFAFNRIRYLLSNSDPALLPSMTVLLNKGMVLYGNRKQGGATFHKYPDDVSPDDYDWCFVEGNPSQGGSPEGVHLAVLYGALIEHLAHSHLEPPEVYKYTGRLHEFRKSTVEWATDTR